MEPGQLIAEKYRLEGLLGEGGMGAVWVATNLMLEKRVALKLMSERFALNPEASERFLREGVAASRVSHPAIVQVFDAGKHLNQPWLAMELLEGESLAGRLTRGPLSVGEALQVARGVLSALAEVHAQGIVHRDLKPENIFLAKTREGWSPKVLDFGVAKDTSDTKLSKLTATGAVVGTAFYLSPEQAQCRPDIDARTDLYAIAVVLFESLAGAFPYEAETITQLVAKMFTEAPRRLHHLAPHLPLALSDVLDACLSMERDRRFQSATALLSALEGAASSRPMAFMATAPAMPASNPGVSMPAMMSDARLPLTTAHPMATPVAAVAPRSSSALALIAIVGVIFLFGAGGTGVGVWLWTRSTRQSHEIASAPPVPIVLPGVAGQALVAPPEGVDAPAVIPSLPPLSPVPSPVVDPPAPQPDRHPAAHAAPRPHPHGTGPGLPQSVVVATVQSRSAFLHERCYLRVARRDQGVHGVVTVGWTIGPDGRVTDSRVVYDGTGNAFLSHCTQNAVRATRFPVAANGQPTSARYPFVYGAR